MSTAPLDNLSNLLYQEFELIWAAHRAVGLEGHMCLYSNATQIPFRTREPALTFWFGADDTAAAVEHVITHYHEGHLPNTPLLLNPVVHRKNADESYTPVGSGIIWCTSLCLGIDVLQDESAERLWKLGIHASAFHRGDDALAGLKVVGICDEAQTPDEHGLIPGCKALYDLANIKGDPYATSYLLSGISYLTKHGMFFHPGIASLFPSGALDGGATDALIEDAAIHAQKIADAAYCWNAYERHHSLYEKFGTNPEDVAQNMGFFNLVARDVGLFDATGPMRKDADEMFEFIVPGLIPRGSVTLLAAAGGVGKSSLAHQLCIIAATDYEPGEKPPRWLGQRIAIEKCKGICVYFSGEDGPAIVNARTAIFDPNGRAKRLMFQRNEFGDGVGFNQYLKQLQKIPDVPIMVIDPARKFLDGDEDDSTAVSDFFDAVEEFAVKKNCAVVVVHHLQKGAQPKTIQEVLDAIRGSQVFIDRSRVIIGMLRDGPYTIAGLAKNNIPPNMGMVTEERVFARDPRHLRLVWLPGHEGVRNTALTEQELQSIIDAASEEGR